MPGDPLADFDGKLIPMGIGGSQMAPKPPGPIMTPPLEPTHTVMRDPYQGPPEWLNQYMDHQPKTDPYHPEALTPEQKAHAVIQNKYVQQLSERERMLLLKGMKDRGAL